MGLEQLLDLAYKATLPIRAIDKIIKLGYDALAAATTKVGIDRFDLAHYTAVGTGTAFIGAGATYIFAADLDLSFAATVASIVAFALSTQTSNYKDYFLTPRNSLHKSYEEGLAFTRHLRLPLLAFGAFVPTLLATNNNLGLIGNLLFASGLVGFSSYMYLVDGDHSLWDKAKAFVSNLVLKSSSPNPGPATSYGLASLILN